MSKLVWEIKRKKEKTQRSIHFENDLLGDIMLLAKYSTKNISDVTNDIMSLYCEEGFIKVDGKEIPIKELLEELRKEEAAKENDNGELQAKDELVEEE